MGKAGILNSVLKKMREEGVLVAGAPPGRKGAGCFKVSSEEKSRMADAAKAAAKKLKAQQKQGLGKVTSKAPKKVAKASSGKKVAKVRQLARRCLPRKLRWVPRNLLPSRTRLAARRWPIPALRSLRPRPTRAKQGRP